MILFLNRQDRYVVVEDCPGLADYYESYIDSIGNCYKLCTIVH